MKKFFKKLFKVILLLILMFGCFVGGMYAGKDHWTHNAGVNRYWEGYREAEAKYKTTATPKTYADNTNTPKPVSTEAPTAVPEKSASSDQNIKVKAGSETYTIRKSIKDELDAYEEYWDKYIETMKSLKNEDPTGYLTKYTEMLQKLGEIEKQSGKRDDLTEEENTYYAYRLIEISKKMLQVVTTLNK